VPRMHQSALHQVTFPAMEQAWDAGLCGSALCALCDSCALCRLCCAFVVAFAALSCTFPHPYPLNPSPRIRSPHTPPHLEVDQLLRLSELRGVVLALDLELLTHHLLGRGVDDERQRAGLASTHATWAFMLEASWQSGKLSTAPRTLIVPLPPFRPPPHPHPTPRTCALLSPNPGMSMIGMTSNGSTHSSLIPYFSRSLGFFLRSCSAV